MKKGPLIGRGLAVGIVLLFVGTSIIPSYAQNVVEKPSQPTSRGNWLYVGGSGPGNYTRIQDAIDNASDGDMVFVYDDSSPYYEHVIIDKSVTLIGEDKNNTIIRGNENGDAVNINANSVTIKNFTVQFSGGNVFDAGVAIKSNNNTIENNIFTNNRNGIYLEKSTDNVVSRNIFTNNGNQSYEGAGIRLRNSTRNKITENSIFDNFGIGIIGTYTAQGSNTISRNNITDNTNGVLFYEFSNNTITDNNITDSREKGITVIYSQKNSILNNNISLTVSQSIAILGSSNNTISRNTIKNSSFNCIELSSISYNNIVERNIISDSNDGIEISAPYNIISNNTLKNISIVGIYLNSDNNFITENTIQQSRWAILTGSSKHNRFYHNNLINNSQNIDHMEPDNLWDNGYPSGGNYWDDYNDTDANGDGIGDIPYNQDRYPLMFPYGGLRANANGPYNGSIAEDIQFIGFACGGTPSYTWSWDFGDGKTSYEQNPVHSYSSIGIYNVTITVHDKNSNISNHRTTATIEWGDFIPPMVVIKKPKTGYIYRNDKEIRKSIIFKTIILRKITIEVNASDNKSGIRNVEFYIDGAFEANDATPPYRWTWEIKTPLHFKHTITVKTYDNAGNENITHIKVWKFF